MSEKLKMVTMQEAAIEREKAAAGNQACRHSNHRLERHLSAPECFRPSHEPPGETDACSATSRQENNLRTTTSRRHHTKLRRSNCSFDRFSSHLDGRQSIGSPSSPSSASPSSSKPSSTSPGSSSSASDSAFSQSQTTLESESDQSSSHCFRNESVKGSSRLTTIPSKYRSADKDADISPEHFDEDEPLENQFKIVWRNLSYRVPEKRFARVSEFLRRQKEAFCPDQETEQVDDPIQMAAGGLADQHLKAPTIGKPRKVIFADLNGCVRSGQITAILGPSGAGKTTFLKCLTNNLTEGVSGSIDIACGPTTSRHLKLCTIPQKGELPLVRQMPKLSSTTIKRHMLTTFINTFFE